jgi:hypothetical protein
MVRRILKRTATASTVSVLTLSDEQLPFNAAIRASVKVPMLHARSTIYADDLLTLELLDAPRKIAAYDAVHGLQRRRISRARVSLGITAGTRLIAAKIRTLRQFFRFSQ